jgi:hypothetical protein
MPNLRQPSLFDPAPEPPPPSAPSSIADAFAAEINACATVADLDKLFASFYAPGSAFRSADRTVQRATLRRLGRRRAVIAVAQIDLSQERR